MPCFRHMVGEWDVEGVYHSFAVGSKPDEERVVAPRRLVLGAVSGPRRALERCGTSEGRFAVGEKGDGEGIIALENVLFVGRVFSCICSIILGWTLRRCWRAYKWLPERAGSWVQKYGNMLVRICTTMLCLFRSDIKTCMKVKLVSYAQYLTSILLQKVNNLTIVVIVVRVTLLPRKYFF